MTEQAPISLKVELALRAARAAQPAWATTLLRQRLRVMQSVAAQIADNSSALLEHIVRPNASPAEVLASELFPLADACRFLARVGQRVLSARTHSFWDGAWWMGRIGVRVVREPWGTILILAPSNYPLFLPGVQIVQALAAGNAVIVKPAPGGAAVLDRFKLCLIEAGLPADILQVIDTSVAAGQAAMRIGVDKVLLTGSASSGRSVLSELSHSLTPSTMELSGCDAVFVLTNADLKRVASCLNYALHLNGGGTCIAPRRIFVTPATAQPLRELLLTELGASAGRAYSISPATAQRIASASVEALASGAKVLLGQPPPADATHMQPLVLSSVRADMRIAQDDLFGPVTSILEVSDLSSALELDRLCPYALGASVFGPQSEAEHWATQIHAGCVVINDIIVPTADPRVSFGGRDLSGWGATRGAEGLLEMTRPKTICTRYGNWLPHLDTRRASNPVLMRSLLELVHSRSIRQRFSALRRIVKEVCTMR